MRSPIKGFALLIFMLSAAFPAASQTVTTIAGNSSWGRVVQVSLDSAGNIYTADFDGDVVYKIDRLGATTVVAGTLGKSGYAGDGALATSALLSGPVGTAVGADGSLYIGDWGNNRIRKVSPNGIITTFAGTGAQGFTGDGGPAASAKFYNPYTMTFDSKGALYFVDWGNHRIRKIGTDGIITTVVGSGTITYAGDGGLGPSANIFPGWLAVTSDGTIYFNDDGPLGYTGNSRIRKVSPNGVISTVAGTGTAGFSGDGGQGTAAQIANTTGVAVDSVGNVYFSEYGGARIRRVDKNGIINTWAGTGRPGNSGDGGPAINAQFNGPTGLTVDSQDNLYLADTANRKIRKITPPAVPSISFTQATIPVFEGKTSFGSNMYVTLYGSNLATTSRAWAPSDFMGSNAPTVLDGVSVTVNNKPAFIEYVSPGQININTPEDTATGVVNIQVKNAVGMSNVGTATRNRLSPSLQSVPQFSANGKLYVVAQKPDYTSFIGPSGLLQGVPFSAAKPGDVVTIFALGCGPTDPATQAGVIAAQTSPLALPYQVNIGGVPAKVLFGGALAGYIGFYQFNVMIPNLTPGDQPIELIVDGVPNAQNLYITVGQ